MDELERVEDHLKQAQNILIALTGDAVPASRLHSCRIHIWRALDDLAIAKEAA